MSPRAVGSLLRLVTALAALMLTVGCDQAGALQILSVDGADGWLDEPLRVVFDGPIDGLTVTERSVRLTTAGGVPVVRHVRVDGSDLELWLRVDERVLAAPPERLELHLAGAPSVHALASADGRLLETPRVLALRRRPGLAPGGGAPRLLEVNGTSLGAERVPVHDGVLRLTLEGRVDPSSLRPDSFPVVPLADGLALDPVLPGVAWWMEGPRIAVTLSLPEGVGEVELRTRQCGLRGPGGEALEPRAVVRVASAGG